MLENNANDKWGSAVDGLKRQKHLDEALLDINPEGELLKEIRDIIDELHMMTKVYNEQQSVAQDFLFQLTELRGKSKEVTEATKNEASRLVKEISRRKAEINDLTRAAERTAHGVSSFSFPNGFAHS